MQYNKDDIERIACNMIARLSIQVEATQGDPDIYKIILKLGIDDISYDYINIRQVDESRD